MVRGVAPRNPLLFTNVDKVYKVRTQTHTSRKSYTGVAQAIVWSVDTRSKGHLLLSVWLQYGVWPILSSP